MARSTTRSSQQSTRRKGESSLGGEIVDFFVNRLPSFIRDEAHLIDQGLTEANLFRELNDLPDSALKRMGLKRQDIPLYVACAVNMIDICKGRGGAAPGGERPRATRLPSRSTVRRPPSKRDSRSGPARP